MGMFSTRLSVPRELGVCLIVSCWCPGLSGRVSEFKYIPNKQTREVGSIGGSMKVGAEDRDVGICESISRVSRTEEAPG